MTALENFFDQEIEPRPLCGNCEYYDGGGLRHDGNPIKIQGGDCTNRSSPRFQTTANDSCSKFFPCSTRWPDADHD